MVAIIAAVGISIVGIGTAVYALTLDTTEHTTATEAHDRNDTHGHSHESSHDHKEAAPASNQEASVVIVYGSEGFEQSTYTVKSGETVRVENKSDVDFYFTTGDHHNHDIHSPLNLGTIAPGAASSFVAPQAGVYDFHNHENEYEAGELIIQ